MISFARLAPVAFLLLSVSLFSPPLALAAGKRAPVETTVERLNKRLKQLEAREYLKAQTYEFDNDRVVDVSITCDNTGRKKSSTDQLRLSSYELSIQEITSTTNSAPPAVDEVLPTISFQKESVTLATDGRGPYVAGKDFRGIVQFTRKTNGGTFGSGIKFLYRFSVLIVCKPR